MRFSQAEWDFCSHAVVETWRRQDGKAGRRKEKIVYPRECGERLTE